MERIAPTHTEMSDNDALYDMELDKVRQKLQRAYMRRDHYAQLYYRAMAELDETKWELSVAKNKIQELKSLVGKMQSSMNGKDMSHWRHANLASPPREHNGQTTPDSGAISMSPVPENNEGHERQVDEEGCEEKAATTTLHSENGYYHGRFVRSNSKHGLNEGLQGDWRAGRQPASAPPVKRVGFCENLPPPIPPRQVTNRSQYDMALSHGYHTGFQRAYTLSESELSQLTQPSMPAYISQNRMHRSHSVAHGAGQMQHPSGATFPRSQYSGSHLHQPVLSSSASAFSLSSDHRLPRVHRGVHGYENIIVPPPNYPMHHPALVHGSAFMKVGNGRGVEQAAMPMDPHYMMQQMQQQQQQQQQMHHQQQFQQTGTAVPTSPSSTAPPPDDRKRSVRIKSGNPPALTSESRRPSGEKRSFSRLTDSELRDLFYQISSPKCSLQKLEISHSGIGKPEVMNAFCQELRKNTSLHELSLPSNGIERQSLGKLLDAVTCCTNIKELLLRNNDIGNDCTELIQNFLNKSHLESIMLTGNPIEHHTHLLDAPLPQEFYIEYNNTEATSGEKTQQRNEGCLHNELKLMHI